MSDVTLPRDFVPLRTSTPKKERDVKRLVEEMKLMDLECETIAVMEGIKDPVPRKSVKKNLCTTL